MLSLNLAINISLCFHEITISHNVRAFCFSLSLSLYPHGLHSLSHSSRHSRSFLRPTSRNLSNRIKILFVFVVASRGGWSYVSYCHCVSLCSHSHFNLLNELGLLLLRQLGGGDDDDVSVVVIKWRASSQTSSFSTTCYVKCIWMMGVAVVECSTAAEKERKNVLLLGNFGV